MANQLLNIGEFPTTAPFGATSLLMDAAGEMIAFIVLAPKAGNIHKIHFNTGTVTTGETLKCSLQNVDMATGDPDGTPDQSGTIVVANADDNVWLNVTLGADRTVAKGEIFAVVFEWNGSAANLNLRTGGAGLYSNIYADHYTGSWAKSATAPTCVLEYSDGSFGFIPGCQPGIGTNVDFNSGSSPNERALKFESPVPFQCGGFGFLGRLTGDADMVLYDAALTPLSTISFDTSLKTSTADIKVAGLCSTDVSIAANTVYYLSVKPTSVTNVRLVWMDVGAASWLNQYHGGSAFRYADRTGAGAFTEISTRRPVIFMLPSGFSDGVGGGSGSIFGSVLR
jgi:hypothetical protein